VCVGVGGGGRGGVEFFERFQASPSCVYDMKIIKMKNMEHWWNDTDR